MWPVGATEGERAGMLGTVGGATEAERACVMELILEARGECKVGLYGDGEVGEVALEVEAEDVGDTEGIVEDGRGGETGLLLPVCERVQE